jgi:hypothetical protein
VGLGLGIVAALVKVSLAFGDLTSSVKGLSSTLEKAIENLTSLDEKVDDHDVRIAVLEARK